MLKEEGQWTENVVHRLFGNKSYKYRLVINQDFENVLYK
jgi:hypothetical protein